MRIRLMGTRAEITAAVPALQAAFDVRDVSDFYPNRGATRLGRIYLDVAGVQVAHPSRGMRRTSTASPDEGS